MTYVDHVGDIVDVVFGHQGVGRRQIEEIVVPRFCALELVFRVLGLSLEEKERRESPMKCNTIWIPNAFDSECITGTNVTFLMRLCTRTLGLRTQRKWAGCGLCYVFQSHLQQ